MPQVTSPQQIQNQAVNVQENKLFRERLRDRYQPLDNVRVINLDNEKFTWEYFPVDGENETFTDNGAVRVTNGRKSFVGGYSQRIPGKEQMWELGAGDTEVLIGANADLFIEGLFKRLVAKNAVKKYLGTDDIAKAESNRNYKEKGEINFNWTDGLMQEQMIDKIFLGIATPNFDEFRPTTTSKEK